MPARPSIAVISKSLALGAALWLPFAAPAPIGAPHAAAQEVQPARGARLDVVFVIDATGSMGDEIEQVKEHLRATARSIASGTPRPDVRFGVVVYRDVGDTEHTRVVPLTRNVDAIHQVLSGLVADGGGDTPEDVDAGLVLAIDRMEWDASSAHLVFLVGDAGPKSYGVDRERLRARAIERRIHVHTLQASGMDVDGVSYFRSWSAATGGVAEVLTYRQVAQVHGAPRTVFRRGSETYVSRRELRDEERELSFGELETRGLVARDDSLAAAVVPGVASATRGGGRGRSAGAAASPSAPAASADSDVGGIVAREARRAAESMGTAY